VLAHVLAQPVEVARPTTNRVVGGDGVGHFLERCEPVAMGCEELENTCDTVTLKLDHHVDEHQAAGSPGMLRGRDQRRDPAERRANEDRRLV
jgi:hypothetical protein